MPELLPWEIPTGEQTTPAGKARAHAGLALGVHANDPPSASARSASVCDPTGVSFENRQDFLRHRSERVSAHNSKAELQTLLEFEKRVCEEKSRKIPR